MYYLPPILPLQDHHFTSAQGKSSGAEGSLLSPPNAGAKLLLDHPRTGIHGNGDSRQSVWHSCSDVSEVLLTELVLHIILYINYYNYTIHDIVFAREGC